MKNYTFYLLLITILFSACQRYDDPSYDTNNSIRGDWQVTSLLIVTDSTETELMNSVYSSINLNFESERWAFRGQYNFTFNKPLIHETTSFVKAGNYVIESFDLLILNEEDDRSFGEQEELFFDQPPFLFSGQFIIDSLLQEVRIAAARY